MAVGQFHAKHRYWAAVRRPCLLLQLRLSAPCQDFWLVLRNQDRVLEMRRWHSIRRANRPAIFKQSDGSRSQINHRLDRQRHASSQFRAAATLAIIRDLGLLVQLSAHAVTDKLAHNRKLILGASFSISEHKSPSRTPSTREVDRSRQAFSVTRKASVARHHADRNCRGRVPHPTIFTTPMSSFTMSPYWIRRALPIPWTISSLSEMQMFPGKTR